MSSQKQFAFVLMPFDEVFDDIYKLGIQAVAKDLDVIAERVDEQTFSESILERIYRQIESADFVIADMTNKNPNVFYEVGFAHAKGKLCTLLTQRVDDIPFDLRHHRHLVYDGSIQKLKKQLHTEIAWLKEQIIKSKSKGLNVSLKSIKGDLIKSDWAADADVEIVLDIQNKTERRSPEIEAIYLHTGDGWVFSQGADECTSTAADLEDYTLKHFIKSPVARLSPGAWAPLKMTGKKPLWRKYSGEDVQDSYRLFGRVLLEIVTSEGNFREMIALDVMVDDLPF